MAVLAFLLLLTQDVPAGVAEQINRLRSDEFAVRAEAERKLTAFGKEAVPALEQLLRDPDADIVTHAKAILAAIDRAARLKRIQEPDKRTSVDLHEVGMSDAVRTLFEPFDLHSRMGPGNNRAGQLLTLKLERATFWQAWDAIYLKTNCMGMSAEPMAGVDTSRELVFVGPFREIDANSTATVGDYRILATPATETPPKGPSRLTVSLILVCPVWAVPKKARFADLSLGGAKIASQKFDDAGLNPPNDRALTGCIRRVVRWEGVDSVSRSSLPGGKAIKLAGTLVLTIGDQENAAPFTIDALPLPPE